MALIVTAEDDEDVRYVTTRVLRSAGHTVIATHDGAEGFYATHQNRPDVVITDFTMPRMTGLQLCRAIRDDPCLSHTPVLMVSSSIGAGDRRAADAGVTALLGKPFNAAELRDRIDAVLRHPSQRGRHGRGERRDPTGLHGDPWVA